MDNWTLVTGYFDLTKLPDATPELRARPPSHYLDEHAGGTLGLDQNLVVFTEPKYEAKIWEMRPERFWPRTRVRTCSFEDFRMWRRLPQIIRNRGGPACARDRRNTGSYYLFCVARYAMLKQVMAWDPFRSSHFAWINICMERMGPENLQSLDSALAEQRDKFSTCYIDYVAPHVLDDLGAFFGKDGCRSPASSCGGTTFCSGFFTGEKSYMRAVCEQVETEFLRCLEAEYGHADEQLLALAYRSRPELFDWYIGDYQEMITNYVRVRARPEQPLRNLIQNSRRAGDVAVCSKATDLLLQSYLDGACDLGEALRAELLDHCKWVRSMGAL